MAQRNYLLFRPDIHSEFSELFFFDQWADVALLLFVLIACLNNYPINNVF